MLFPAEADEGGTVSLGPLRITPRQRVTTGRVKVAVRPEAWHIGPPGAGLAARLAKAAYLGSNYEYTFETELGAIFVVSPDLTRVLHHVGKETLARTIQIDQARERQHSDCDRLLLNINSTDLGPCRAVCLRQ